MEKGRVGLTDAALLLGYVLLHGNVLLRLRRLGSDLGVAMAAIIGLQRGEGIVAGLAASDYHSRH